MKRETTSKVFFGTLRICKHTRPRTGSKQLQYVNAAPFRPPWQAAVMVRSPASTSPAAAARSRSRRADTELNDNSLRRCMWRGAMLCKKGSVAATCSASGLARPGWQQTTK